MKQTVKLLVVWFLRRHCEGAFHVGTCGPGGRFVALLTESQYHAALSAPYLTSEEASR